MSTLLAPETFADAWDGAVRDAARATPTDDAAPLERAYTPFPGPQSEFDAADEFEQLFGGAKGPGKSHALLFKPLKWVHKPAFKALFLRVDFPSLRENIDRAHAAFPRYGAVWNEAKSRYTFPSGARYEFGYGETLKDIRRYQGREPSMVLYDEVGQLAEERVWTTLLAELRSPDPTIPRMACASANPGGPGEPWLMKRFVKPCGTDGQWVFTPQHEPTMTRRFIPARVTDNPIYANDAQYMATLRTLPHRQRQQLLEGKWGIGTGRGLDELDEAKHIVPAFEVPKHWQVWGAFDWGYGHPFACAWFAMDEDGVVYVVDSVHGHRMLPWEQAEKIRAKAPARFRSLVYAGHDCWAEKRARGESVPTIAETFQAHDILLVRASIDRVQGLNNLREWVKWQGPDGVQWAPRLLFMDTPGNRRTFDVLESMMVDPDDPEDVLKRDADPETGEGGDDPYDCIRYGMAARQRRPSAAVRTRTYEDQHPGLVQTERGWARADQHRSTPPRVGTSAPAARVQPFHKPPTRR